MKATGYVFLNREFISQFIRRRWELRSGFGGVTDVRHMLGRVRGAQLPTHPGPNAGARRTNGIYATHPFIGSLPPAVLDGICHYLSDDDISNVREAFPHNVKLEDAELHALEKREIRRLQPDLFHFLRSHLDITRKTCEACRIYVNSGHNARERFEAVKEKADVTNSLPRDVLKEYSVREAVSQELIRCTHNGDLAGVTRAYKQERVWVNAADEYGCTALHWAAHGRFLDFARLLLEDGANVHAINQDGDTPLSWAATGGYLEVARLLLEYGANFKGPRGWIELHEAVKWDRLEIMRLLVENDAKVNAVDEAGRKPLDDAPAYWGFEARKLLGEKGIPNWQDMITARLVARGWH